MKTLKTIAIAAGLVGICAPASALADNSAYGETRINELPVKGLVARPIWVGSWWAYSRDGIAYRHKLNSGECSGVTATMPPQEVIDADKAFCLSASEKIDLLEGRIGDIEWDKIAEYQRIAQDDLGPLQERVRELVRVLNKWIADNPGGNWRETEDGIEYLAKQEELETAKGNLPEIDIDTATEFERIEHGKGVPGVGSWWGHCNAWAAAALIEDEPKVRGTVTHNGVSVDFTPGEAKALITEIWMEHHSSFHGSRHNDKENEGVKYDDLTPAAFHIFFGTQVGKKKKGFVIDRFTGDEVWNQPVRSYIGSFEKMYEGDQAEKVVLKQTTYNARTGEPEVNEIGERDVYPVQYTTTIHWITDGLPHEVETLDNINAPEWPTDHSRLRALWHEQVEMRTLTYTLYLDKPIEDASARIIGDGEWDGAVRGTNHAWPDFVWQPLTQTPSRRDYENPHVDPNNIIHSKIIPATADQIPVGMGSIELTAQDTPLDIPDNNPTGVASIIDADNAGSILSAEVRVDITHTYRGDLKVIVSKDGQSVVLHDRAGGSSDDLEQTFTVREFDGQAAAGQWSLKVVDTAGQDVGKINSWTVVLTVDADAEPPVDPPAAGEGTFNGAGLPTDIPDNDAAGISNRITVADQGTIEALEVTVDITHTWRGDLLVVLKKGGESVTLHNRKGRGEDDLKQTFTVDSFDGKELQGDWVLEVSDHARRDVGKLNSWSIQANWR